MSRYRKIEVRTWSDEKFRQLSAIPPSGQGLWFFLLTGPHTTAIPGLFRAGRAGMAEELGWEPEAFDEAFAEVSGQGMAEADFKAKLVWLPKAIQHNKPESPNVVRGWRVELDLLPECELKRRAIAGIREALEAAGPSYVEAFDEVLRGKSKGTWKPSGKPTAKPSCKTMSNQEQEQEQEQEGVQGGKPPRPPKDAPVEIPEWMPDEPWQDFVAMRRAKGKRAPFTVAAARGIVADLGRLRGRGQDVAEVLRQSVVNGWSGVFEVKGAASQPGPASGGTFV